MMVNAVLIGLSLGCTYGMIAIGFSLVYRTTGIINLAQGSFVMLSGLSAAWAVARGMSLTLAMILGVVVALVCGSTLALGVIIPLWQRQKDAVIVIVGTFIYALIVEDLALNAFGSQPLSLPPLWAKNANLLGATVPVQYFFLFGVTAVIMVGTVLFLRHTDLGLAMRAVAEDAPAARLVGIAPHRQALLAMMLSALVGGVGGVFIAPLQYSAFNVGLDYSVFGFVAAIVGGLDSVGGSFAGGVAVGLLEALASIYASSTYQEAIVMVLLFLALIIRPRGLIQTTLRRYGT